MGLFGLNKKNKTKAVTPVGTHRQYQYSFSGADAKAFVYFEGMESTIRQLTALHTVSVSVHEAKGQARALGFRGIKGLARGVRTIGGSMILTVVEDNPLRPLMENLRDYEATQRWPGWSIDRNEQGTGSAFSGDLHFSNRIAPLLPPTNMLIQYVSEGALWSPRAQAGFPPEDGVDPLDFPGINNSSLQSQTSEHLLRQRLAQRRQVSIEGAGLLIRGLEFIDEGIVTSSNDVVTEVTLSFIALDLKPISAQIFDGEGPFAPIDEDQRADWQLRDKLFGQNSDRVRLQQTAEVDSTYNDFWA